MVKERTLNWMLILMAILLLVSAVAGIVYGDYPDGFDGYNAGNVAPGPWTFTPDSAPCWPGSQVNSAALGNVNNAQTPPNFFSVFFAVGCAGANHFSTVNYNFNATSASVTFSFYVALTTVPGVASTDSIQTFICGSPQTMTVNATTTTTATFLLSSMSTHGFFTKLTASSPATIGSVCGGGVQIKVSAVSTESGGFGVAIDTTNLKGGNAVFPNYNFVVFDQGTGQWFNMSNYAGSYITVGYGNGNSPVTYTTPGFNGISAPDIVLNTLNGNTIVLNLGSRTVAGTYYPGYTTQMLIPNTGCTSASPCRLYIGQPQTPVFAYAFAITDLSGKYPAGSTATITQGQRLFSSGLTDPLGYAASLVPGKYTFTLTSPNGANTFSTIVNLPAISGYTQPIQILKLTVTNACGGACTIGYGAAFNSAGNAVVAVFNDTSLLTTKVTMSLEKQNATGTFQLGTGTFSGTFGNLQDSFSCTSNNCNTTLAAQMFVAFIWTGAASGTANVPLAGGNPAGVPNIPSCILEWCVTFPNITPLAFISYSIIISFAAIFGAYSAKFGAVVVSLLTATLAWFGWITPPNGLVTLIVALAVTAFLAFLEGGR